MTARELIVAADAIRQSTGISQAEWSRAAGLDDVGVAISRTYSRGDCKLSTLVAMLKPLGYELQIVKVEDMP